MKENVLTRDVLGDYVPVKLAQVKAFYLVEI